MKNNVRRLFVEKRQGFRVQESHLLKELKENLHLDKLEDLRILNCYDVQGIGTKDFERAIKTIFSEANVDNVYIESFEPPKDDFVFGIEYLPGQFDQRADSAAECIQILTQKNKAIVKHIKIIVLKGSLEKEDIKKIKKYMINPIDSQEAMLTKPLDLEVHIETPEKVKNLDGFIELEEKELKDLQKKLSLAMSKEDLGFCKEYFKTEGRNPTITEIRAIDTYWSDHCRHTTFLTHVDQVSFEEKEMNEAVKETYKSYLNSRKIVYGESKKPITLMDIAVIGMKEMKKTGKLEDLDESEEINACSIKVEVEIDGENEDWLVMFKNETHNHPTEIEPFGGAATCLGGAVRDPLSGRSYVYQAMRITGSGDPRTPVEKTLNGKLPQRKITVGAAQGYSSYGNQIGLSTGQVEEYYHPNFIAKRMEVGAVIAAAPAYNVIRMIPEKGDIILLVGGRTGRDGCGGATGSSKEQDEKSILECGAEVQKGNPATERKIQRLFRNPKLSRLIKRCNDFGAGGVSVAIGELADSIDINLDCILKKYEGLDGTELAISESQERMAVVLNPKDVDLFLKLSAEENLEAKNVAVVTDSGRLRMFWRGQRLMDIGREFLNSNGISQHTKVHVKAASKEKSYFKSKTIDGNNIKEKWEAMVQDLNVASKQGLVERFDSSIGSASVLMPFGGRYQKSPVDGMVAKIPVLKGETTTGTIMTHGYDPYLTSWSPFHGGVYALISAMAKTVALGGNHRKIRYSLQEYFEKLGKDPERWGKPFSALLGALSVQKAFSTAAIGGKDSMSGTFKDLDVPPTLIAFAVSSVDVRKVISPEFKNVNNKVYYIKAQRDSNEMPDYKELDKIYTTVRELIESGNIVSARAIGFGGLGEAVSKMAFGNRIGIKFNEKIDVESIFQPDYGSLVVEVKENSSKIEMGEIDAVIIGETSKDYNITLENTKIDLKDIQSKWEEVLNPIFPIKSKEKGVCKSFKYDGPNIIKPRINTLKPRVIIPVLPGTNCEYDMEKAFKKAGAEVETLVFKNLTSKDVEDSIEALSNSINRSQIVALPGGFSAGDEPDGSGKFIATVFRNPKVKESLMNLLNNKDGLMIGICNGFQALIKLGLLPYGEIRDTAIDAPTLTYNKIGRHISAMAHIKVSSNMSPWLSGANFEQTYQVPLSHGEGRFVARPDVLKTLIENGQVATRYVDLRGEATYDGSFNFNGSLESIEGITSPDGRVFGKMGHSERIGKNTYKNIIGEKDMKIFESGVKYFR